MYKLLMQIYALLKKQLLLSTRSPGRSIVLIAQSFLVMFIVWAISQAVDLNESNFNSAGESRKPPSTHIPQIPSCRSSPFLRRPCYSLLYSSSAGSNSTTLQQLISQLLADNSMAPQEVLQFDSANAVDSWLLSNPARAQAAVLFDLKDDRDPSFVLQVNTTSAYWKGKYRDPNTLLLSMQVAVEQAWIKISSPLAQISVAYQSFPHPSLSMTSVSGSVLPVFILASIMMNFVVLLIDLVSEKESGQRHMLRTQGLHMLPYWFSWSLPQVIQGIIHSCLLVAAARAFSFEIVIHNDYSILILLIFLCNLAISFLAMAVSCLLDHSSLAVPVSMGIFLFAWILQLCVALGLPWGIGASPAIDAISVVFAAFPFTLLSKAILDLSSACAGHWTGGITWNTIASYCYVGNPPNSVQSSLIYWQGPNCFMPISEIFVILPIQCLCYLVLTFILDLFLARGSHDPEPALLLSNIFSPSLWWQAIKEVLERDVATIHSIRLCDAVNGAAFNEDQNLFLKEVKAETAQVSRICRSYLDSPSGNPFPSGLFICGLRKIYPKGSWYQSIQKIFKVQGRHVDSIAVDSIWLGLHRGECLCLLGPNGAGKSTTIKSIIGSIRPDSGDVIVNGCSVLCSPSKAQASIGVCPQFDAVWRNLSVREHLSLVSDLKFVSPSAKKDEEIESLLSSLRLSDKADEWAGKLSGGMRRRLSVALALIGSPSVVLIDEPSSGLDELSRRALWNLISDVKKTGTTAILLTTHSMEEAEELADRCSIMKQGSLCCLGSPLELKRLLNGGARVKIDLADCSPLDLIANAARAHLGVELEMKEGSRCVDFVVQVDDVALLAFLDDVHAWGLRDDKVHVSLTSLEDAYLSIVSNSI